MHFDRIVTDCLFAGKIFTGWSDSQSEEQRDLCVVGSPVILQLSGCRPIVMWSTALALKRFRAELSVCSRSVFCVLCSVFDRALRLLSFGFNWILKVSYWRL